MDPVGQSVYRIDARGKTTGETLYPGDIHYPGMLMMKVLFARRPHARILAIDTRQAESLAGVVAVFTARDVPVNEYGLIMPDQPVLCGPGSEKPYADRVRFIGDQVALVVAEDELTAQRALDLIRVEYEDLPVVLDPVAAMEPEAPLLHPEKGTNVLHRYRIEKGDLAAGFAQADVIVEAEYRTPAQEHAYLQPEAGVAYIDEEGRVTVEVAGQWAHEDQKQIAHALGLPREQVRVRYPAIGGAFGGREDMSVQIILALAAWRLHQRGIHRPVKIIWSREESIIGHHKRHPYILRARWGATRQGKIVAAEMDVIADAGAYAYTSTKVQGNATMSCTGPYSIPNVLVNTATVYTNHIPGGAFRGFGGPQGTFAAEQQVNKLAEALGMDPVELRLKNCLREGLALTTGSPPPPGVSMPDVIEACARRMRELAAGLVRSPEPHLRRGIGFACGFKNVGFSFGAPEECWATVEIHGAEEIERAVVRHAGADMGQGAHTVFAQMTASAVGLPMEKVQVIASDTATSSNSGSTSASRMTFMAGNAIRGAAEAALQKWAAEERPAVATYQYKPPATTPLTPGTGASIMPNFSYGYIAETAVVEVDIETGQVRLVELVCADDVGKAINPQQVEGQIEGAVVQAMGYVIQENFSQAGGYVQTSQLSTYLIPTVLDIPERVEAMILEFPEPNGPWQARGMAEMPYIPLAPAVTAAVQDALGAWMDEFPLTPERVLRALGRLQTEMGG